MVGIRVTYTGLIAFVIRLTSIATGLVFTLIVTRQLTEQDLGSWSMIGALISYVILVEPTISYWVTREIARGTESGRTALMSSGIFIIGSIFVYIIIAYLVGEQSDADVEILLFGVMLVPLVFIERIMRGINAGWKPHVNSYGFLGFEIAKIPVALILIYFLNFGLKGAIIATVIGYIVSIIVLSVYVRKKISNPFNTKFLKKWLKLSWLPLYRAIPGNIFLLDIVIFSVISGSVVGVAYITVARAITNLVTHTFIISRAVYPKLLEGGKQEYFQENLMRVLYFAIPFFAMSITFARPALFALNPIYEIVVPVVLILSPRAFLTTLNKTFFSALQGIEKVDVKESATFKEYVKSRLFLIPTIQIIQYATYAIFLFVGLSLIIGADKTQLDLVIYWAIIGVGTEIPFFIYYFILVRKSFTLNLDKLSLLKYSLVSIMMFSFAYFLMDEFLEYDESIFLFLPNLLIFVVLAFGGYIIITFLIDNRTKILVKAIVKELKIRTE